MTRALLQQALDALVVLLDASKAKQDDIAMWMANEAVEAIRAELAKPEHPAHTEAEVQEIMDRFIQREVGAVSLNTAEATIRRILGVPAP